MNKLIATGTVVDNDQVTITASVYVELIAEGKESTEAGAHYVTLGYKKYNADAMPTAPVTVADITADASLTGSAAGSLVVPGFGGHADVTVGEPTAIKYTKTKAFVRNEKAQVYAAVRFCY